MQRLLDRRVLLAAYGAYLLSVLYLVLWPQPDAAGGGVEWVTSLLHTLGLRSVTGVHVEVLLNVALFVPFGLLGVPLWRRPPWWAWGPVGLAFSAFLEAFQWAFLPDRSPTVTDLVANTTGALLGAGAVAVTRREVRATTTGETARPRVLRRRHLAWAGGAFVAVLLVLVLQPSASLPTTAVLKVSELAEEAGAPRWLASTYFWERLLNVMLFVPFGVLAALVRPGWSLLRWAAVGLAGSLAIELTQGYLLPGRDGSLSDLATNTTGTVLGAWLARSLVARSRRASRSRPR